MNDRGFAISGVLDHDEVSSLAAGAEQRGYASIWLTVPAAQSRPVDLLRAALESTTRADVGLGAVPLDRFTADALAGELAALTDSHQRIVIGLGAGGLRAGAARRVEQEIAQLKEATPGVRVAIASYGAVLLQTAGRVADAVLLNWMTPARMRWAVAHAEAGAVPARRSRPAIYLYVASAVGAGAAAAIDDALLAFRRYPYHRRHQDAMHATETVGAAVESAHEVGPALARYAGAIPVVNPVSSETPEQRRRVLDVFAPSSDLLRR